MTAQSLPFAPRQRLLLRLAIVVLFHLAAAAIDLNVFSVPAQSPDFHWPCSLRMLHCDAALLCILFLRCNRSPSLLLESIPLLISGSITALILYTWTDFGGLEIFSPIVEASSHIRLDFLITLLLLPLITGVYWLLGRPERRTGPWLILAAWSLVAIGQVYLASTMSDARPLRHHSYWIDLAWLRFLEALLAAIQCIASIAVGVWIFDRFPRASPWRALPSLIGIGAALAAAAYLHIYITIRIETWNLSGSRIPISQFHSEAWTAASQAASDFIAPALTGLLMMLLAASFWLTGAATFQETDPSEPIPPPGALPVSARNALPLSPEERRLQIWRLTLVGLLLSALSLALGFYDWIAQIQGGRFADRGGPFEVLLMAPLGLWSAQMAASALFLECRLWNFWKRLLMILAWAEITLLAFWGQIALSETLRWRPSEYVGTVFCIVLGALLLTLVGRLITKGSGAALRWRRLDSEEAPQSLGGRFSLSLSDLICLVAVCAALIYPSSVVFALEDGWSLKSLPQETLISGYWPLMIGAAGYFAIRAYLSAGKKAVAPFAFGLLCLLASTASDERILAFIFDRLFFGIRWSVGIMALPGLLLGVSILSIALHSLGFEITDRSLEPTNKFKANAGQTGDAPTASATSLLTPQVAKELSPWD